MPLNVVLVRLALVGAAVAVVYQIAPGDPAWMTVSHLKEPPSGPFKRLSFAGGDGNTMLSGRLYMPSTLKDKENAAAATLPPVVVMANGLGLTQDAKIGPFVHAFTDAGFAAITFDYATFGYSGGWPRHQVKPQQHVADLKALLKHLQKNGGGDNLPIDISRVALWGTSMGGGHVLVVASDSDTSGSVLPLKAVVGNIPHVKSALESIVGTILRERKPALTGLVKVTGALLKWAISQVATSQTTYIPLHGALGSSAMMQNPGDDEGYSRLILSETKEAGWANAASVGSIVPTLLYRPYNTVSNIQIPALLLVAENDTLCPAAAAYDAAETIKDARLFVVPNAGHFDLYDGKQLQTVLEETVAFLREHV